ncbi:hypothetical protein MF406_14340 [Georgenia sp. TF02-10]|uniref:hypothetical protein n=1 Tax=Georgenia sp. TF02-10 TaxID=2917725 RepID=UPI001FA6FDDC|nr:hypothetical protein [Georgenia sp. TF02-10]UNX54111.1 hypothetical protein MF406_14340 [Georgenia sp. TF02-10]
MSAIASQPIVHAKVTNIVTTGPARQYRFGIAVLNETPVMVSAQAKTVGVGPTVIDRARHSASHGVRSRSGSLHSHVMLVAEPARLDLAFATDDIAGRRCLDGLAG